MIQDTWLGRCLKINGKQSKVFEYDQDMAARGDEENPLAGKLAKGGGRTLRGGKARTLRKISK